MILAYSLVSEQFPAESMSLPSMASSRLMRKTWSMFGIRSRSTMRSAVSYD